MKSTNASDASTALRILHAIQSAKSISRAQIVTQTNLAASTVTVISAALEARGVIRECGLATSTGGRPPILLEMDAHGGVIVTVALSGQMMTVGVLNLAATVVATWNFDVPPSLAARPLYEALLAHIDDGVRYAKNANRAVIGIGLAVPGLVDRDAGVIVEAENLGWSDMPIVDEVVAIHHVPVVAMNNTNATAYGEYQNRIHDGMCSQGLLCATVGRGIGAGMVLGGKLYTGSTGMAGEIGHVVIEPGGLDCACGNRGCLETVATPQAIERRYLERALPRDIEGGVVQHPLTVLQMADAGDNEAAQIVSEAGAAIGQVLGNQVNVQNLDTILLGGRLAESAVFFRAVYQTISQMLMPKLRSTVVVERAALGRAAALVGVTHLTIDETVARLLRTG